MKPMNYWNNKKKCLEEAKKYRTAYELQRKNYSCYEGLRRNGWVYEAYPPKDGVKVMNYWKDKDKVIDAAKKCSTKEENLNGEESLIGEDYWVKWYKNNGWTVLNKAKTGRLSGSLGAIKKWDYDTCKEFCKNYTFKTELKKANYSCYYTCLKNGWFEEFGIKNKYNYGKNR